MKRILAIVALAALLAQAASAQDSPDPSVQSVLDAARAKHFAGQAAEAAADAIEEAAEAFEAAAEAAVAAAEQAIEEGGNPSPEQAIEVPAPFTPLLISFTPGLNFPFGTYDAALSFGLIGTMTRDALGFQASSVFSMARNVSGFQGAGVFNIAEGSVDGFQGAGVFNIAGDAEAPIQVAGVFNIAGDIEGLQLAGAFNVAERVKGGQVSPVVNVAGDVEGFQLGLVNIADRVEGVQIGLINIAREPGVSSEGGFYEPETDYVYLAFQGGTRHLYGLLAGGIPKDDWNASADRLVLSYGLGSRLRLSGAYLDMDLSAASYFGPELPAIGRAIEECRPMADASGLIPYPSLRLCLGVPILGRLTLVGGLKADVDLDAAPRVPEGLKRGYSWSSAIGDIGFTSWTKWYIGVKI